MRTAFAAEPLLCPAGAPIGGFELIVSAPGGGPARTLQTVNRLLPDYRISYRPVAINSLDKKKARIALVLVPSDSSKMIVLDPKPAVDAAEWTVPVRTSIVSVVWGPLGLDKAKVRDLVSKNDEIIGQLADYAQKTQQTEALIQALAQQQQALDTGQSVDAAVVGFASQFPNAARIDRTASTDQQMLTLLHSVNPAIAAYDPLAENPSQRVAQSAVIAAAVAGLFFGNTVGLAAGSGALLVNMHSIFFPRTEFRSAFAQTAPDHKNQTALCGNRTPSVSRTQLAFLWATRVADTEAPAINLVKTEHLPIGVRSSFPIKVNAREWKLAARVQDWKLISADGKTTVPVNTRTDVEKKTLELDLTNKNMTPGIWKLAGSWDWDPVVVSGDLDIRPFSTFESARLSSDSQDKLTQAAGKVPLRLEGSDFQFVEKVAFKSIDDKFAQPAPLPFSLPTGPRSGREASLETQIDAKPLAAGNYAFLLAQGDSKVHEVPFKVLPAPPQVSNLPVRVNTGSEGQHITLHGTGLDRINELSADKAEITLDAPQRADERGASIKLAPDTRKGERFTVRMKVKDVQQSISLTDAIQVAGPKPLIGNIRVSLPPDLGIALGPGELPASSFISFVMGIRNAERVSGIQLACADAPANSPPLQIETGESKENARLRTESPGSLFLSFDPESVGQPGCAVTAKVLTQDAGDSEPKKLGRIVRLPKIESFQLTDEQAGEASFYGVLKGQDLETVEKVGWDSQLGNPVEAIPAPVAGEGSRQTLKIALPWPAPSPHSALYIWLRNESKGRATTARY